MSKIKLGISIGDLNGIGLETIIKTFKDKRMLDFCTPIVFGSSKVVAKHKKAIEINDFRFAKPLPEIGARNVISTNGASEYWLRNKKIFNINDVNLNDLKVTLIIDNKIMDSGNTRNVLNNPLNAALWLINNLTKKGETLLKGQFISSGSCTKPSKIYSGNHIKAQFEQLEDIEFQFI